MIDFSKLEGLQEQKDLLHAVQHEDEFERFTRKLFAGHYPDLVERHKLKLDGSEDLDD